MRGRAGSVFDISVFPTRISVSGLENFAIWTLHTSYRDESGMNSVTGMASSCFACCIFHIISITFNYSDTAISVAKAMTGAKVISLCFAMVWFSKFAPETLRGLLSSRKRGWNYWYEPKSDEISPGNWAMWRGPKLHRTRKSLIFFQASFRTCRRCFYDCYERP